MRIVSRGALLAVLVVTLSHSLAGQFEPAAADRVDAIATKALADTGAPSVSVAILQDGKLAYVRAYGNARLGPSTPASSAMRPVSGSARDPWCRRAAPKKPGRKAGRSRNRRR